LSAFSRFYDLTSSDIFAWCAAHRFEPNAQQRELLDLVQWESTAPFEERKRTIACKSGQGPGKTAAITMAATWRTWRHVDALTFVTAPTQHQVRDVFLTEYLRWYGKAVDFVRSMIEVTRTRIIFNNSQTWGLWAAPASEPENFAGRHEKHMTIVVDEATGVERPIMETIVGTLTNPDSLLLCISNPTDIDCYFYDLFTKYRENTHCLTFNCEDCEENEYFSLAAARKLELEFGRESDVYRVRVLGEFPSADPQALMRLADVEACGNADLFAAVRASRARQIGIDLARFGSDESVAMMRSGEAIVRWEKWTKCEPAFVLNEVMRWQDENHWRDEDTWYVVDTAGIGDGAVHVLHERGKKVFEFKGQERASEAIYENRISEAWFHAAKAIRQKSIRIPEDGLLVQQLTTRKYLYTSKGKLVLEPKDLYVKRFGSSPDRADALILAFYPAEMYAGRLTTSEDAWQRLPRQEPTQRNRQRNRTVGIELFPN